MEIMRFFFAFLIMLILSCKQVSPPVCTMTQLPGNFHVYKEAVIEKQKNGWDITHRYDRLLKLNADSSFEEINVNYECFAALSYYGKWKISGDTIMLIKEGTLDELHRGHNEFTPDEKNAAIPGKLLIENEKHLKVSDDGFLQGETMEKQ